MNEPRTGLVFGALAPPLAEQLAGIDLDPVDVRIFQEDANAITRLAVRGLLPREQVDRARQRLIKTIARAVKGR